MAEALPQSCSDIPLELAGLVLRRLPAHVDRIRFAAVCPQWRLAAREIPLPPPLPLLALPDGTVYSLPGSEPLRFPACAGYTGACDKWLVFSGDDGYFLRNPFSNATVTLPPKFRFQACRELVGDTSGVRWRELHDTPLKRTIYKLPFCAQLIATFVRYGETAMVAVCRPGSFWWSLYMDELFPLLVDMVFHQRKLCALNHLGHQLYAIDISLDHTTGDPWISGVQTAIHMWPLPPQFLTGEEIVMNVLYLVELCGALLKVNRKMHGRWTQIPNQPATRTVALTGLNEFEVFKANFETSQWTKVTTLGDDQVLFLQRRCSRFVSASQNDMPGDCIVFLENDDEDHDLYSEENSDSCCVYDMKTGNVSTGPLKCSWKRGLVPGTWLFPED